MVLNESDESNDSVNTDDLHTISENDDPIYFESLSEKELYDKFITCLGEQKMGSYMLNPTIWHKASSKFVKKIFPKNLPIKSLREEIPFFEWDFVLKSFARANGVDVTAHADIGGNEIPIIDAFKNAEEKGLKFLDIPNYIYLNPSTLINYFRNNFPVCFGGNIYVDAPPEKLAWSMLIAYSTAVCIHEQNINGGWEQVISNIYNMAKNDIRCILYGIAGFLLVNDIRSAYSLAYIIKMKEIEENNNFSVNITDNENNVQTVILDEILCKKFLQSKASELRLHFLTNMIMNNDNIDDDIINVFAKYASNKNSECNCKSNIDINKNGVLNCPENHGLILIDNSNKTYDYDIICDNCDKKILNETYTCNFCNFDICKKCYINL